MLVHYDFSATDIMQKSIIDGKTLADIQLWCNTKNINFLTDEQLVHFIISCNDDIKVIKKTIENYLRIRSKGPELFSNLYFEDDDVQKAVRACDIAVMPERSPNNNVIIFGRLTDTNYHNFHLSSIMKYALMVMDFSVFKNPANGITAVIDMKGVGILHLTRARMGVIKKFFEYIQDGLPYRISEIHILNTVSFIDKILFLVKPFMKNELFEAISFHRSDENFNEIFSHLPKNCIPEDYGGHLPPHRNLTQKTYDEMDSSKVFYLGLEAQIELYKKINK